MVSVVGCGFVTRPLVSLSTCLFSSFLSNSIIVIKHTEWHCDLLKFVLLHQLGDHCTTLLDVCVLQSFATFHFLMCFPVLPVTGLLHACPPPAGCVSLPVSPPRFSWSSFPPARYILSYAMASCWVGLGSLRYVLHFVVESDLCAIKAARRQGGNPPCGPVPLPWSLCVVIFSLLPYLHCKPHGWWYHFNSCCQAWFEVLNRRTAPYTIPIVYQCATVSSLIFLLSEEIPHVLFWPRPVGMTSQFSFIWE